MFKSNSPLFFIPRVEHCFTDAFLYDDNEFMKRVSVGGCVSMCQGDSVAAVGGSGVRGQALSLSTDM